MKRLKLNCNMPVSWKMPVGYYLKSGEEDVSARIDSQPQNTCPVDNYSNHTEAECEPPLVSLAMLIHRGRKYIYSVICVVLRILKARPQGLSY